MSDFKAKIHLIRFRLGLRSGPTGEAYSAPPDSLAGFKGAMDIIVRAKKGRKGEGKVTKGGVSIGPTVHPVRRTFYCRSASLCTLQL